MGRDWLGGWKRILVGLLVAILALALTSPGPAAARKGDGKGNGPGKGKAHGKGKKKQGKGKRKKRRPTSRVSPRLLPFDSCEALAGYADAQATRIYGPNYRPVYRPWPAEGGLPGAAPLPASAPVSAPASAKKSKGGGASEFGDFSQTNNQELNVDEPDIVKTDGNTIFAVGGGTLNAIDARAPISILRSSMQIEGTGHQLLLVGSRLLVMSQDFEIPPSIDPSPDPDDPPPPEPGPNPGPDPVAPVPSTAQLTSQMAVLTEIDVSNPADMKVVSTQRMAGRYVSARLVDNAARIVISTTPEALGAPESKLTSPIAGWVPYSHFHDNRTNADVIGPLVEGGCEEITRPEKFSGLGMLSVLTIDMARGLPAVDADEVMSDGRIVYASANSLYVSTDRAGVFIKGDPSRAETAIHRFDIAKPEQTFYAASGTVRGTLMNQFSMSEYNGYLRVASTGYATGKGDGNGTESFVSIYQQQGPELVRVGRVGSLGLGERIQGVRMIGDKAYVVTFRRVDPLYTLDLSNPANPRVLGELKILGYSAYLHPIGEDKLIGIGPDATELGERLGAQISLFDVSNLKEPKRIAHRTVPGGRSAIEDTHLAFLYWQPRQLAVMPVTAAPRRFIPRPIRKPAKKPLGKAGTAAKRKPARRRQGTVTGAYGYRIRNGKISQVGTIVHSSVVPNGEAIERSLVVGDRLFTVSCRGIGVTPMATFQMQAWLPFSAQNPRACFPFPEWRD